MELSEILETCRSPGWMWVIKRLSANDTGATQSHQVGPYIPKQIAFSIAPSLQGVAGNPDHWFLANINGSKKTTTLRLVWYNQRSRNECRITNWGGASSPLNTEATGALIFIAFHSNTEKDSDFAHIHICISLSEEEQIEEVAGQVEPGEVKLIGNIGSQNILVDQLLLDQGYPNEWNTVFPTGIELADYIVGRERVRTLSPDRRLLHRRKEEEELFKLIEKIHLSRVIRSQINSTDDFIREALSALNRRKSRSGKSLELHLKKIFDEESLSYTWQGNTEENKKIDFIFPSIDAYHDPDFPDRKLTVLASKTTLKDRWRQIINEANRLRHTDKHLVTIQRGVSENQFQEIRSEKVVLVVPKELILSYPANVRKYLLTLQEFINHVQKNK